MVIPLGVGLQVQRLSTIPAQVRLAGAVKVGATGIWINGSSAGDTVNMVSNPYPLASRRLDQLGLYNGANDPTAQASLAGGGGLNDADLVRILDPQSGVFTDFYYNTSPGPNGNRWRAGMTDASLYTIPEGASVAVIRRANRSPFVWYAPPPAMNLIPGTPPQPLTLVSAVSRRAHPGGGVNGTTFVGDINLPLAGDPGIECRAPDAAGNFTIVLTFSNPVVSAAASVGGVAAVTSINGKEVTITAGVSNAQTLTIAVNSAVDVYNQPLPAGGVSLSAGFLLGDVTASRGVNSGDTAYVRSQSGTVLNPANLRADVNASGQINSGDVGVIQQKSGTGLP